MPTEELNNYLISEYAKGKSLSQIGRENNVCYTTIKKRLVKLGIKIRKITDNFNKNISKEYLEELYCNQGLTLKEMCKYLGCKNTETASKILHQYGIETNINKIIATKNRKGMSEKEFGDYIKEQYIWNNRSMLSIAKEFNVSPNVIYKWFDKLNIPKRSKSEQSRLQQTKKDIYKKTNGYLYYKNNNVMKYQHRKIVEQQIGRPLLKSEVVHHIDENKSNNALSNLLLLTNSNHAKLHMLLRKGIPFEDALKEVVYIWRYE